MRATVRRVWRALPITRVSRFGCVGLTGVGVNYAVMFLCYAALPEDAGYRYGFAAIAGALVSILTNFFLNDCWTWGDRRTAGGASWLRRIGKYYLSSAVAGVLPWIAVIWCQATTTLDYRIATALGIAASSAISFALSNAWVFARPAGTTS